MMWRGEKEKRKKGKKVLTPPMPLYRATQMLLGPHWICRCTRAPSPSDTGDASVKAQSASRNERRNLKFMVVGFVEADSNNCVDFSSAVVRVGGEVESS